MSREGRRLGTRLVERVALAVASLGFVAVFVFAYTVGRPTSAAPAVPAATLLERSAPVVPTDTSRRTPAASPAMEAHVAPGTSRRFTICHTGGGIDCVVDGDTLWVGGEKIRVADIDAPETHPPRCAYEADLGDRATRRLAELVNAAPFELRIADRDVDRYGRKLRVIVRNGRSLGDQLVAEGLARTWEGRRRPWC
jgi:endonuclease YncB( thermonuclease family)